MLPVLTSGEYLEHIKRNIWTDWIPEANNADLYRSIRWDSAILEASVNLDSVIIKERAHIRNLNQPSAYLERIAGNRAEVVYRAVESTLVPAF